MKSDCLYWHGAVMITVQQMIIICVSAEAEAAWLLSTGRAASEIRRLPEKRLKFNVREDLRLFFSRSQSSKHFIKHSLDRCGQRRGAVLCAPDRSLLVRYVDQSLNTVLEVHGQIETAHVTDVSTVTLLRVALHGTANAIRWRNGDLRQELLRLIYNWAVFCMILWRAPPRVYFQHQYRLRQLLFFSTVRWLRGLRNKRAIKKRVGCFDMNNVWASKVYEISYTPDGHF